MQKTKLDHDEKKRENKNQKAILSEIVFNLQCVHDQLAHFKL